MDDPPTEDAVAPDRDAEARAAELVGKVVSERYRIDQLLAIGGMGAVYRGTHQMLKKRVAIKVLRPDSDNLPEMLARFEREAIAGAHVVHPNVAAATDFGQLEDGSHFLVLEYVSGKALHRIIRQGPLPPARAAHIGRQLAAALGATHAMGIVHRDVKPANVMIIEGEGDVAKLIDFGLAKVPVEAVIAQQSSVRPPASSLHDGGAVPKAPRRPRLDSIQDARPRLTGVGMIVGTVAYLAPETALGMDAVDARADLYGLGLVLYQMLTGRHPWDAETSAQLFAHQRFTPPPPFAERAPGVAVPPALEAVVMKLLSKDPAERYPTGAAVVEAIDAIAMGTSPPNPGALGTSPPNPGALGTSPPDPGMGSQEATASTLFPPTEPAPVVGPPAKAAIAPTVPMPAYDGAAPPAPAVPASRAAGGGRSWLPVIVGAASVAAGVVAALVFNSSSVGPSAAARPPATALSAAPAASPHPAHPPPAPTAEPAPSSSAAAPTLGGAVETQDGEPPQRALLLRSIRVRDWGGGETSFLDLVAHDPTALRAPDLSLAARDLAVALEREHRGDRIFEALADRLGIDGLDILYDLVSTRGKAAAALRAAAVLKQPAVLARATPALRISFELREAPCADKLGLLDRAVAEGDGRTLVVLQTQGVACFRKNNKAVQGAMAALRAKLRKG